MMCELKSLDKLKDILAAMPDHNLGTISNGVLELDVLNGVGYSHGLFKNEKIAVARTTVSKDVLFEFHYHPEAEFLILYEGELLIWVNIDGNTDKSQENAISLGVGDMYRIDPNTPHMAKAVSDSRFIAITIPASQFFPNASK